MSKATPNDVRLTNIKDNLPVLAAKVIGATPVEQEVCYRYLDIEVHVCYIKRGGDDIMVLARRLPDQTAGDDVTKDCLERYQLVTSIMELFMNGDQVEQFFCSRYYDVLARMFGDSCVIMMKRRYN